MVYAGFPCFCFLIFATYAFEEQIKGEVAFLYTFGKLDLFSVS